MSERAATMDHEAEAAHEETTVATISGAFLSLDSAACAVRMAADALRGLHVRSLWYAGGADSECEEADAQARTAWAALADLADTYERLTAEYLEEGADGGLDQVPAA